MITAGGIGFAKDRFAMKPLVVIEQNGELTAATEEQAVRRVVVKKPMSSIMMGQTSWGFERRE